MPKARVRQVTKKALDQTIYAAFQLAAHKDIPRELSLSLAEFAMQLSKQRDAITRAMSKRFIP